MGNEQANMGIMADVQKFKQHQQIANPIGQQQWSGAQNNTYGQSTMHPQQKMHPFGSGMGAWMKSAEESGQTQGAVNVSNGSNANVQKFKQQQEIANPKQYTPQNNTYGQSQIHPLGSPMGAAEEAGQTQGAVNASNGPKQYNRSIGQQQWNGPQNNRYGQSQIHPQQKVHPFGSGMGAWMKAAEESGQSQGAVNVSYTVTSSTKVTYNDGNNKGNQPNLSDDDDDDDKEENQETKENTLKICPKCIGKGVINDKLCPCCNGKKEISENRKQCGRCSGSGKNRKKTMCTYCNGECWVAIKTCPVCRGAQWWSTKGIWDSKDFLSRQERMCMSCYGIGKIAIDRKKCDKCAGHGFFDSTMTFNPTEPCWWWQQYDGHTFIDKCKQCNGRSYFWSK